MVCEFDAAQRKQASTVGLRHHIQKLPVHHLPTKRIIELLGTLSLSDRKQGGGRERRRHPDSSKSNI
jgi:hypothetical protein